MFDGTRDGKNYDIYIMSSEDPDVRRLTDGPTYEQAPVFVQVNKCEAVPHLFH